MSFLARRLKQLVVTAILSGFIPLTAFCQSSLTSDDGIELELAAMGKRGGVVALAREQTLAILQTQNACSDWFREVETDPAEVFRSLHYQIEKDKPSYVFRMVDDHRRQVVKQPWAARATQYGGRDSTIELNPSGPFFSWSLPVRDLDGGGSPIRLTSTQTLTLASFKGATREAQTTILLHELGHIVGRLAEDDDSWDGRSSRNTEEVVRHCRREILGAAHGTLLLGN